RICARGASALTSASARTTARLRKNLAITDGSIAWLVGENLAVERLVQRDDAVIAKAGSRVFRGRGRETRVERAVGQQPDRGRRHPVEVLRRVEKAGPAVVDDLREPPDARRHDRDAAGHRLEGGQ